MLPGDSVYFVADTEHVPRAMAAFGHEEQEARRIIIMGGGNIGLSLARLIEESKHDVTAKIIELDRERARTAAETLPGVAVILGDGLDPEILAEANVSMTETVVAVTDDDETNILSSLLAKRYGAERAVTLINKTTYSPLITTLGIDVVVSPRAITVSTILQHVRRGRIRAVHSLGDGFAEVIEADALETSPARRQTAQGGQVATWRHCWGCGSRRQSHHPKWRHNHLSRRSDHHSGGRGCGQESGKTIFCSARVLLEKINVFSVYIRNKKRCQWRVTPM